MGDWSTRMTSWTCSAPSTPAQFTPAPAGRPLRGDASERWMTSCTSVDLPEPETPVTATIRPRGISMSMFCRLCAAQPRKRSHSRLGRRRVAGTGTRSSPARYRPGGGGRERRPPARAGAEGGGELDALGFAAGQRRGQAVERDVVEPDFVEEAQPVAQLFQDFVGDGRLRGRERELVKKAPGGGDGQ